MDGDGSAAYLALLELGGQRLDLGLQAGAGAQAAGQPGGPFPRQPESVAVRRVLGYNPRWGPLGTPLPHGCYLGARLPCDDLDHAGLSFTRASAAAAAPHMLPVPQCEAVAQVAALHAPKFTSCTDDLPHLLQDIVLQNCSLSCVQETPFLDIYSAFQGA